ncbi:hypothetical protein Q8G48_28835, partial [Klebsiella pneumoniae]|uniref:hypothetical protein n=1 Tax=Klebsiella pneumoniae TaxID=573 RepID=UPI0030134412
DPLGQVIRPPRPPDRKAIALRRQPVALRRAVDDRELMRPWRADHLAERIATDGTRDVASFATQARELRAGHTRDR